MRQQVISFLCRSPKIMGKNSNISLVDQVGVFKLHL